MPFQFSLITDHKIYKQPLHEVARLADEAGLDYFLLREKELTDQELLEVAQHLRPNLLTTKFIVNGSLAVALAVSADGIHLQKDNIPIRMVRKKHPHLIIGYSAHSLLEMENAALEGADYVFISPIFSPGSKPGSLTPIGVEVLSSWIRQVPIPVFALGGITRERLQELIGVGCSGVAGISMFVNEHGQFTSNVMQS